MRKLIAAMAVGAVLAGCGLILPKDIDGGKIGFGFQLIFKDKQWGDNTEGVWSGNKSTIENNDARPVFSVNDLADITINVLLVNLYDDRCVYLFTCRPKASKSVPTGMWVNIERKTDSTWGPSKNEMVGRVSGHDGGDTQFNEPRDFFLKIVPRSSYRYEFNPFRYTHLRESPSGWISATTDCWLLPRVDGKPDPDGIPVPRLGIEVIPGVYRMRVVYDCTTDIKTDFAYFNGKLESNWIEFEIMGNNLSPEKTP